MGVKKRTRGLPEVVKLVLPGLSRTSQAKGVDRDPIQNNSHTTHDVNLGEVEEDSIIQPLFWKGYQEEAKSQDNEFVASRDKNLDTMLVFAGLYSAILTAFLIDSTALLQQNPTDITNALLLDIAQSQWRMETGSANSLTPPVQLPSFRRPPTARAVNCLWYMALMLSLASAMLAMLAKEWLAAFIAYDTCVPRTFALQRQGRLNALRTSSAITLIDWIPMLLHISLLLFTLGLIIQIWAIDSVVAISIMSMSLIAAMFYLWTVVIGAIFNFCPYQARLSAYARRAFKSLGSAYKWMVWSMCRSRLFRLFHALELEAYEWLKKSIRMIYYRSKKPVRMPCSRLKEFLSIAYGFCKSIGSAASRRINKIFNVRELREAREWDAIEWLLDNARDQRNINTAYQWITGLGASKFDIRIITGINLDRESITANDLLSIVKIGEQAIDRLGSLRKNQYYDLISCKGANAARYALLLSEAHKYTRRHLPAVRENFTLTTIDDFETISRAEGLVDRTLPTLDDFWEGKLPPIAASSNTLLVVAELEILVCTLNTLDQSNGSPTAIAISIIPPSSIDASQQETNLHNRANRGFCWGGLLLYYFLHHQTDIAPTLLTDLLSNLYQLANLTRKLKLRHILSDQPKISAEVGLGTTISKTYTYEDPFTCSKPEGLLIGLISLLEADTVTSPLPEKTKYYTAALLPQIMLKLTEQWTQTRASSAQTTWQEIISNFAEEGLRLQDRALDLIIVQELLELTHFAIRHINHQELDNDADILLNTCLKTLDRRTSMPDDRKRVFECLSDDPSPLKSWVRKIDDVRNRKHSSSWYSGNGNPVLLRSITLRLLANKGSVEGHQNALSSVLHLDDQCHNPADTASRLETILEAMYRAPDADLSDILQQLEWYCTQNDVNLWLWGFTKRNGFMYLSDIGARDGYKARVISTIKVLVLQLAKAQKAQDFESNPTEPPHGAYTISDAPLAPFQHETTDDSHSLLAALIGIIKIQGEGGYSQYSILRVDLKVTYYTGLKNVVYTIKGASERIGDTRVRDDANSILEAIQDEMMDLSLPNPTPQPSDATDDQGTGRVLD
ncbi:unnamed protein product [Rhizoctonia solani]|uniref:DUF6535 domain-containing protein n=1 Tax=Rhizoctonia solani TaxID=456999 RepID=A0A8H3DRP5_9AGAM|nr:unnamed protein product [Rhizoctonia solani]